MTPNRRCVRVEREKFGTQDEVKDERGDESKTGKLKARWETQQARQASTGGLTRAWPFNKQRERRTKRHDRKSEREERATKSKGKRKSERLGVSLAEHMHGRRAPGIEGRSRNEAERKEGKRQLVSRRHTLERRGDEQKGRIPEKHRLSGFSCRPPRSADAGGVLLSPKSKWREGGAFRSCL